MQNTNRFRGAFQESAGSKYVLPDLVIPRGAKKWEQERESVSSLIVVMPRKSRATANATRDASYKKKKGKKKKGPKKSIQKKTNNGRRRPRTPRRQSQSNVHC